MKEMYFNMKISIVFLVLFTACSDNKIIEGMNDIPHGYCIKDNQTTTLDLLDAKENTPNLPDTLVISPGLYKVYGKEVNLSEGLCRIIFPQHSNQQRIVYDSDVKGLLSSIAWVVSHGTKDSFRPIDAWEKKAKAEKLSITCGEIVTLAAKILADFGIQSRLVTTLTLDQWNTYDNGHTLLEVKLDNVWQLYDLDHNAKLTNLNNNPLTILSFADHVKDNSYKIDLIATDSIVDVSGFKSKKGYDYVFMSEQVALETSVWYKRMIQVVMVQDSTGIWFFDKENRSRIESYSSSYRYMEKSEFIEKFYK